MVLDPVVVVVVLLLKHLLLVVALIDEVVVDEPQHVVLVAVVWHFLLDLLLVLWIYSLTAYDVAMGTEDVEKYLAMLYLTLNSNQ